MGMEWFIAKINVGVHKLGKSNTEMHVLQSTVKRYLQVNFKVVKEFKHTSYLTKL